MAALEIRRYQTRDSRYPFEEWLESLQDRKARIAIELGPGYRVYYAQSGRVVVLLLCGGDKSTQDRDIVRACSYWLDWQRRKNEENTQ